MYLKRLELFGFKSFNDKTTLELNPDVTAVIGPNGCGKSNLVDAVRWVLGEQSARALRGIKMEEVIFAGTEQRKPLNFAEISLTFAGAGSRLQLDYDEIAVTRRLYRSGESEYFINKAPCRLKDITELFMDTGVGRDFYSVIGQGRVEELISSRPEDRREIFEEAAGILKYKMRKREAQRRLEETRDNMVRVQDLILELGAQVDPLREQAVLAREYRSLLDQVRTVERELYSHHLARGGADLARTLLQLQEAQNGLAALRAEEGESEERFFALKQRRQNLAELLAAQERELNRLLRESEQADGALKVLDERSAHAREQAADKDRRRDDWGAREGRLGEEREKLREALAANRAAASSAGERHSELQDLLAGFEHSSLYAKVEQRQRDLHEATAAAGALAAAVEELSRQAEQESRRPVVMEQEEEDLSEKIRFTVREQEELRERREVISAKLADLEKEARQAHLEGREAARELEQLQQRERELDKELRACDSRLQLLQEQESELSGYYRGVREIMQAVRRGEPSLPGIVGPVVDLITVPPERVRAIEAALGGGLQYIVTETEEAARRGIAYLKKARLGWATFLPLDTLRLFPGGLDRHSAWKQVEGSLGRASELVEVDPAYRKAVDYLAASTAVVQDLEAASRVARAIEYSCRVVTLEGDLVNPGGALRGGSAPRAGAGMPLGRKQEIAHLSRERAALAKELAAQAGRVAALRERLAAAEKEGRAAEEARRDAAGRLDRIKGELAGRSREEQRLRESLGRAEAARVKARQEGEALRDRLAEKKELLQVKRQEAARMEEELAGTREQYRRSLAERKELETSLTAVLLELNTLREQERSLQEKIGRLEEELHAARTEKERLEQEKQRLGQSLESLAEERRQVLAGLTVLREKSAAAVAVVEARKQEAGAAAAAMAEAEEEDRRRRARLARLEKRERYLAVEESRLRTEESFWKQRYHELFGSRPLLETGPDYQPEEAEGRIALLKEDLESLGEVNLGAIEELARLEERLGFLEGQLEDLQKGEQSLRKVLAEIDGSMERSFTETFARVRDGFQDVFAELFEGGQANLKLSDPDNVLESGIEIVAQPPGKKLQNITLLSAGEKVLTALALIFAVLRHKPAPFYLLDEVESALDEANLARFIRFLERASREAQFIMITHRRQTMELAGVIYGVTMPEPGVSRLVSVRLDELAS